MKTKPSSLPPINAALAAEILVRFLREEAAKFGFRKAVIGVSGGIDSAVAATLAARAFGPRNLLGAILPYTESSPQSESLARKLASQLRIRVEKVEIASMADGYLAQAKLLSPKSRADLVRRGNVLARCRMIALYDLSARENALVIGTSNKSEQLLGYGTLFGDMASAINPLGDLYKTQVYELGRYLKVPHEILRRKPSADLWKGQTSEEELGFRYAQVDPLLFYLVDRRYSESDLIARGFDRSFARRIAVQVARNQYKRRPPVIAKLSNRTINLDYRYLRDWGR